MATRSGKEACGCCHSRNAPQDSRQQRTFHWLLLSSSVQWFAMMLSITSEYGVWMRVYGDDFGGQARLLSALASAGSVIGFCVNPLLAALADGRGRKAALLLAEVVACAKAAAICLFPAAPAMIVSNLLMPVTIGSWEISSRCMVSDLFGESDRRLNAALGQLTAVPSICAVLCPLAGNFLANRSLRLPFGTQALLWLFNIALVSSLPETAPRSVDDAASTSGSGSWRDSLRALQPLSILELFRRGPRLRALACSHVLNEMTEMRSLYQVTDLARAQVLGWGMAQRSRFSSYSSLLSVPGEQYRNYLEYACYTTPTTHQILLLFSPDY